MREKGVLQTTPTQNVEMMTLEPCEGDPSINMVLRSDTTTGGDARKQPRDDEKGRDDPIRKPDLEIEQVKGMSKEAQKSFIEVSTPCNRDPIELGMYPSTLTTFLETCMKLLCDNRVVKGLQVLITRCMGLGEPRVVWKLRKHALCTRGEMRMMVQIGKYEMD